MNNLFESWCPIKGFEDYHINKLGDIFSWFSKKFLKQQLSNTGYLRVQLYKNKRSYQKLVHRLMGVTFLKNPNQLSEVNHKDGNKVNNNLSNLEWMTTSDNIKHAYKHGLRNLPVGIKNSQNKLSLKQIKEIKLKLKQYKYGMTASLGREYNVCQQTISAIKCGKIWGHIC